MRTSFLVTCALIASAAASATALADGAATPLPKKWRVGVIHASKPAAASLARFTMAAADAAARHAGAIPLPPANDPAKGDAMTSSAAASGDYAARATATVPADSGVTHAALAAATLAPHGLPSALGPAVVPAPAPAASGFADALIRPAAPTPGGQSGVTPASHGVTHLSASLVLTHVAQPGYASMPASFKMAQATADHRAMLPKRPRRLNP